MVDEIVVTVTDWTIKHPGNLTSRNNPSITLGEMLNGTTCRQIILISQTVI